MEMKETRKITFLFRHRNPAPNDIHQTATEAAGTC